MSNNPNRFFIANQGSGSEGEGPKPQLINSRTPNTTVRPSGARYPKGSHSSKSISSQQPPQPAHPSPSTNNTYVAPNISPVNLLESPSSPPSTPGLPSSASGSKPYYYPPTFTPTSNQPSSEFQFGPRIPSKPYSQPPRPSLRNNPNSDTPRGPRALPPIGQDPHHSPSEKAISLLVTSDSERYVTVDLSGVKTAAEMKELILNKLNIYDEDESNPYLFYQTEIGPSVRGDALSDVRLVALCHELGDAKGTLKFLVTQASAPVLEPPVPSRLTDYSPPSLPQVPIRPLRTKPRHASRSRNGSVSSAASEMLTPEIGAGYEADTDNNYDREGPRPSATSAGPASYSKAPPLPPSPPRRPSLPHANRPSSPEQPTSPLPISERFMRKDEKHVLPPIPNSMPPPPSPHRASFGTNDELATTRPYRHGRSPSDAGAEQEKAQRTNGYGFEASGHGLMRNAYPPYSRMRPQASRDTLRRQKQPDDDELWQEAEGQPVGRRLDEMDPQSPRRGLFSSSYVSSSQRPHSPYTTARPHVIHNPPRSTPPVPSAGYSKARAHLPISSGILVSSTVGESARGVKPSHITSPGWKPGRLEKQTTKSMNDMRNISQIGGNSTRRPVPPTPQLPILSSSSHYSPSGTSGMPKSYDPTPKFSRPLPPKVLPTGNSPDVSSPRYGHGGYSTSLTSPNTFEPYARPQSAAGETTTSPTRINGGGYTRLQSPSNVYGPTLDPGGDTRSPRTVSPNRVYHAPGFMNGPRPRPPNSDRGEESNISGPENLTPPLTPQDQQDDGGYVDPSPPLSPRGITSDKDHNSDSELTLKEDDRKYYTGVLNGTYMPPSTAKQISRQQTPPSPPQPPSRRDSLYSVDYGDDEYDSYIGGGGGTWIVSPQASGKNASRPPLKVQIETPSNTNSAEQRESPPDVPQKDAASTHSSSATVTAATMNLDLLDPHFNRTNSTSTEADSDTWEFRPPPENIYDALEKFFPKNILDKPVIEANSGETSPTNAEPVPALLPMPIADDRSRIRAKKSIRIVAQEHKKRIDRTSKAVDMISQKDIVMRKRSTKLWGSRLEEVTNVQGRNNSSISLPESPSGGPTTFKWVRGELIGKGTYGQVYMALNATTGEMIAVKQVELPQTASDKNSSRQHTVVQALKMESETLRDLDHPHIVQYLGFEETPANLSIFLEYVPGGSVGSCLHKHGKFADNVTRSFTAQILSGLEYLHSKGIMHRDMKADNILVEMSGICKISDFGISKRTEDLHGGAFTAMQGTVFWMAPEVVNAQKKGYNFKIDIWSMGCVVLEMWAGMRPWMGEEMVAVMFKLYQSKQPPPVPEDVILGEDADDFRRKCFAINPEERPSAAELRKHPYLILPPGWTFTGFT